MIEFTTSFGKFYLAIKATLPEHVLEFPKSIDFSLCPIRETAKRTFVLKNIGELTSYYEWEISQPFSISPRCGSLAPESSCTVTIEFKSLDASVFTANAVCSFGDKKQWEKSRVNQAMTIYGIGKYSNLTIEGNHKSFDFGEVFVGKSAERKFTLENHSVVISFIVAEVHIYCLEYAKLCCYLSERCMRTSASSAPNVMQIHTSNSPHYLVL